MFRKLLRLTLTLEFTFSVLLETIVPIKGNVYFVKFRFYLLCANKQVAGAVY